jgi:hypothetical protein
LYIDREAAWRLVAIAEADEVATKAESAMPPTITALAPAVSVSATVNPRVLFIL